MQLALNAAGAGHVKNLAVSNAVFWVCGALVAVVMAAFAWSPGLLQPLQTGVPYIAASAALGAGIVLSIAYLILNLGAGSANATMLAGQVVGSVLIAHWGWLGTPCVPLTPIRVGGIVVMLAGAIVAVSGRLPLTR